MAWIMSYPINSSTDCHCLPSINLSVQRDQKECKGQATLKSEFGFCSQGCLLSDGRISYNLGNSSTCSVYRMHEENRDPTGRQRRSWSYPDLHQMTVTSEPQREHKCDGELRGYSQSCYPDRVLTRKPSSTREDSVCLVAITIQFIIRILIEDRGSQTFFLFCEISFLV